MGRVCCRIRRANSCERKATVAAATGFARGRPGRDATGNVRMQGELVPVMTTPLVSVVLPVYNGADCVGEAVDSILRQTFNDFELIAISEGSTKADPASVLERLALATGYN